MPALPPRYTSRPLPAAAYVPGVSARAERPVADAPRAAVDVDALATDDGFRYALDLFNHGFPWEAHEAWEPLWFAAPRDRGERALLQGLIHTAAAAVKARAGALAAARGFVTSARTYFAFAPPAIIDLHALLPALEAWADDPAQPPPVITLAA